MIILTEAQFIRKFKPERTEIDELYVQRNHGIGEDSERIDLAFSENRLWTAVYNYGWEIRSGLANGDVLYYVICEVPYEAGKKYLVMDEDGDDEEE